LTIRKGDRLRRCPVGWEPGSVLNGLITGAEYVASTDEFGGPRFPNVLIEGEEFTFYAGAFEVIPEAPTIKSADKEVPSDGGFRPAQSPEELIQTLSDNAFVDRREEASVPTPGQLLGGDNVVTPNHYSSWAIEPIKFIRENELPFWMGNVIKYVIRASKKNGLEDLKKARRYLDMEIARMEGDPEWNGPGSSKR